MKRERPVKEREDNCRNWSNMCKSKGLWAWVVSVRMDQKVNVKVHWRMSLGWWDQWYGAAVGWQVTACLNWYENNHGSRAGTFSRTRKISEGVHEHQRKSFQSLLTHGSSFGMTVKMQTVKGTAGLCTISRVQLKEKVWQLLCTGCSLLEDVWLRYPAAAAQAQSPPVEGPVDSEGQTETKAPGNTKHQKTLRVTETPNRLSVTP